MKYKYKAKKGVETIEGAIVAESSAQAISKLEEMGYVPVKVEAESKRATAASSGTVKKIPSKYLNMFTRQLASMVKSKVQLIRALDILAKESGHEQLQLVVSGIKEDVKQGKNFSEALQKYPKHFSKIYVNMVASGEKGGILDKILLRLVEFAEREEEMKSKVQAAMAYPLLMAFVGVVSIFVMFTFVMPKLTALFEDMGQDLPAVTRILIAMSDFAQNYWYGIILFFVGIVFGFRQFAKVRKNRIIIDGMLLKMPVVGKSIKNREIARFARTVGLLLGHGIPIRDALGTTIPTMGNLALEKELGSVSDDLAAGKSVSQSLSVGSLFPGYVLSMISVGEEAGELNESFTEIASSYEKDLDNQIKVISSLIEPVLILSIGLVVGFIIIAMLMPIFEMNLR